MNKKEEIDLAELSSIILAKYQNREPVLLKLIVNMDKEIQKLAQESLNLKQEIQKSTKSKRENKAIGSELLKRGTMSLKEYVDQSQSKTKNCALKGVKKGSKSSDCPEVKRLKEKVEGCKKKYRNMISVALDYEKKMDDFVKLINGKEEVKKVLEKNGIRFNET